MKNEKLMSLAAVFGWFGAYLFISIIAVRLPEGVDCAATILALWGLILVCARSFEDKKTLPEMLSHGGINKASLALILFAFLAGAGLNLAYSGLLPLLPIPKEIVESYIDASAKYEEPQTRLCSRLYFLCQFSKKRYSADLSATEYRALHRNGLLYQLPLLSLP